MTVVKTQQTPDSRHENSTSKSAQLNSSDKFPVVSTDQLFGAAREIGIEHEDALYRLRITKQGKLVLNK